MLTITRKAVISVVAGLLIFAASVCVVSTMVPNGRAFSLGECRPKQGLGAPIKGGQTAAAKQNFNKATNGKTISSTDFRSSNTN